MNKQVHLLNGDALLARFPKTINGEQLICRECFVEGPVKSKMLADFFKQRSIYLNQLYGEFIEDDYNSHVADEFYDFIRFAEDNNPLILWFEDDLFCQVNLWFSLSLLFSVARTEHIYLVRPPVHSPYGFVGLSNKELESCYDLRIMLTELPLWNQLWTHFQEQAIPNLLHVAQKLSLTYPFVLPAVGAYIDSIPQKGFIGRPKERLKEIILELKTRSFGPVFQVFCERESIYGYGDLMVKRLFDELMKELK